MALSFTIIGMSDAPSPNFSPEVLKVISSAKFFSGGKRHHTIVEPLLPKESRWVDITVPLENVYKIYRDIDSHIVVFASGDPLFFGFASTLKRVMPEVDMKVYPYFNSLQMLAHSVNLPYSDMHIVSLTGREWKGLDNALIEHREKIGILTDREKTPDAVAKRMLEYGFDFYSMYVGEHLGNPSEQRLSHLSLQEASEKSFRHPNCLILTIKVNPPKRRFGIDESEFNLLNGRSRMITKMPIRLLTLQKLDLYNRRTFWDVGFCTGSVSIEARLMFPHLDIFSFEIREEGRELMESNSRKFSAPGINYTIGDFLTLDLNEKTDAAFIGGHGGKLKEIMERVYGYLTEGGCIVFNSVTMESKETFIEAVNSLGMSLKEPTHIELDNNNPIEILKAVKE